MRLCDNFIIPCTCSSPPLCMQMMRQKWALSFSRCWIQTVCTRILHWKTVRSFPPRFQCCFFCTNFSVIDKCATLLLIKFLFMFFSTFLLNFLLIRHKLLLHLCWINDYADFKNLNILEQPTKYEWRLVLLVKLSNRRMLRVVACVCWCFAEALD